METLIQKAQQGDRKSMRTLLINHQQLLESVVGKFIWDKGDSSDVLQNICLRVLRAIHLFRGNCRFTTWLYRIAVNECIESNRQRYKKRLRVASTENEMDVFPDPDAPDGLSNVGDRELREVLDICIENLPEGMRSACRLYYAEQYTGSEAAEKLNITLQAFFVRLSAARVRLKEELIKKGIVL